MAPPHTYTQPMVPPKQSGLWEMQEDDLTGDIPRETNHDFEAVTIWGYLGHTSKHERQNVTLQRAANSDSQRSTNIIGLQRSIEALCR